MKKVFFCFSIFVFMMIASLTAVSAAGFSYNVIFNSNGGTGTMANQAFVYGTAQKLRANKFTRNGYTFKGWNKKADGSGTSYTNQQSVKNLVSKSGNNATLYAQWTINTYKLTYNTNGGTGCTSALKKKHGQFWSGLCKPTRTGYTFQSWNTQANGRGTTIDERVLASSNLTVYAIWKPIGYFIKYEANGGSGMMDIQSLTYGTAANLLKLRFGRSGHTFAGWNTKADGSGKSYKNQQSVLNLTSTGGKFITLYAQWKVNSYTLTYNTNGGNACSPATKTRNYGSTWGTLCTPTRTGYIFQEWYAKVNIPDVREWDDIPYPNGPKVSSSTQVSGDLTIYARWTPIHYTVVFNANGGTGTMISQYFAYNAAQDLQKNTFTRANYTFTGWNTKADGSGTNYTNGQNVKNLTTTDNKKITLYAQWSNGTFKLAYNSNGGNDCSPKTVTKKKNETWGTLCTPKRTGYVFKEWNTQKDGKGTTVTSKSKATANITIYAIWTANKYTVKFNANGGSGSMSNQSFTYGTALKLATNTFKRTNYTFSGWNTRADGKGTSYSDGQGVSNLVSSNGGSITLYAQWKAVSFKLTYNSNGGNNCSPASVTKKYNEAWGTLCSTQKTGSTFKGWNTKADGSGTKITKDSKATANITVYAIWEGNKYTVKYNSNSGTGSMSNQSFTYGKNQKLTKNSFKKSGYTFNGWNTKADGKGKSYNDEQNVNNLTTASGGSVTLYAQWYKTPKYKIKNYRVDYTKKRIDKVSAKTNFTNYKSNFELTKEYSISLDLGNKQYIYTGSKVRILLNNKEEISFINVVRGDTNGDGILTKNEDYVKVQKHLLKQSLLQNEYLLSADVNDDNTVNSGDLLKLIKYINNIS